MQHLLPINATPYEKALSLATDWLPQYLAAIEPLRRAPTDNPPPSVLPFLVYEFALGELTPYVPNLYDLIEEGLDWQRVRGTRRAMEIGLGWLTYTAEIEENWTERVHWNGFQLALDRVRDQPADLERIEGIATLSVPKRSVFARGYHGYDVRAGRLGFSRNGFAIYGDDSGVRVREARDEQDVPAKWSFGRRYEMAHTFSQAELEALGIWREEVPGETSPTWSQVQLTWAEATFTWASSAAVARREAIAADLLPFSLWFVFKDAEGAVIGSRLARAKHFVDLSASGPYRHGGQFYRPSTQPRAKIYAECFTGFGNGHGGQAASVSLAFGAVPTDVTKPGVAWQTSGGLAMPNPLIAERAISITFGRTIRERVCALLTIQ